MLPWMNLRYEQQSCARYFQHLPPNKALQTDKAKLSRLLHSQEPRQLALAADLVR
jgi:hypothetical protein